MKLSYKKLWVMLVERDLKKTEFAKKILEISQPEDFNDIYDLKKKISQLETEILSWNYYK